MFCINVDKCVCEAESMHRWQCIVWDWTVSGHSCKCMCIFVWITVLVQHALQPVTHGFAATTLARVVSAPAGWQRGETLSVAHPGGEGLPAHLLSHHLGSCVCGCPAPPDPLGSHCADGHLLFPTSRWIEKTTNRPCCLTLCSMLSAPLLSNPLTQCALSIF